SNMNRPFRGSSSRAGAGATLTAALLALVVLGCSSPSATPSDSGANPDAATQVTGTAGGSTFVAAEAIFPIADLAGFELHGQSHEAASGQVLVTSVDTSALAGTFDVVLSDTNEHVTGSFVAASCPSFDPNRTPLATCQ